MKINPMKFLCLLLFVALPTTAWSTGSPHTEQKTTEKTANGAVIGPLTADSKGRQINALIETGLEPLAAGSIGYYMDVQEARLRQRLRGSGVSVTRLGNLIHLNLPGNITFATGSPNINARFLDVLNSAADVLKEYNKTTVDVVGHTDSVGIPHYNQRWSENCARSVAEYLSGQGVLPARLLIAGMGESQPVASNATPEGRAKNRRVIIRIAPLTAH